MPRKEWRYLAWGLPWRRGKKGHLHRDEPGMDTEVESFFFKKGQWNPYEVTGTLQEAAGRFILFASTSCFCSRCVHIPLYWKGDWDKGRVRATPKKMWFTSISTGSVTVDASQTTAQRICILGMLAGNAVSWPLPWLKHMLRATEIPRGHTHASWGNKGLWRWWVIFLPYLHVFLISGVLKHTDFHLYSTA